MDQRCDRTGRRDRSARCGALAGIAAALALALPPPLAAQPGQAVRDTARVLLLEHTFGPDGAGFVVTLQQHVVYRAVVSGPGDLAIDPQRHGGRPAYLVPISEGATTEARIFEVYPLETGPHTIRLAGLPSAISATLRLYSDTALTRQIQARNARAAAFGLMLDGGVHSGYRLDPTGGASPSGGSDLEACLLVATGDRLTTCVGFGRQHFPSARFSLTWVFIEERAAVARAELMRGHPTELGLAVRFSAGLATGPRSLAPKLLSGGLYVAQRLVGGMRQGWSVFAAWEHGRLGYTPETEHLDTDRLTAGLTWLP
jgi:hypothetical protein